MFVDHEVDKRAVLYRIVQEDFVCPYGTKAKLFLERRGYEVEDHHLTTKDEIKVFLKKHNVRTTPQAYIDGVRIGGLEDIRKHFFPSYKS